MGLISCLEPSFKNKNSWRPKIKLSRKRESKISPRTPGRRNTHCTEDLREILDLTLCALEQTFLSEKHSGRWTSADFHQEPLKILQNLCKFDLNNAADVSRTKSSRCRCRTKERIFVGNANSNSNLARPTKSSTLAGKVLSTATANGSTWPFWNKRRGNTYSMYEPLQPKFTRQNLVDILDRDFPNKGKHIPALLQNREMGFLRPRNQGDKAGQLSWEMPGRKTLLRSSIARKNREAVTDYINEVIKTNRTPLIHRVSSKGTTRHLKKTHHEGLISQNGVNAPSKKFSDRLSNSVNTAVDSKALGAKETLKVEEVTRVDCLLKTDRSPETYKRHKLVGNSNRPSSACPKVTLTTLLTHKPQNVGCIEGVRLDNAYRSASVNLVNRQDTPSRSDKMSRIGGTVIIEGAPSNLRTGKFLGKSTQSPSDWSVSIIPLEKHEQLDVRYTQKPPVPKVTNSPICLKVDSMMGIEHPGLADIPLNLRMHTVFYCGVGRRTYAALSREPPPAALRYFANSVVLFSNVLSYDWLTERIVSVWADACLVSSMQTNNSVESLLFACVCPANGDAGAAVRGHWELQCFNGVSIWEDGLGVISSLNTELTSVAVDNQVAWIVINLATRIPVYTPLQVWKKHRLFIRNLNILPHFLLLPALPKQSLIWRNSCLVKLIQRKQIILSASHCLPATGYSICFPTKHCNVSLKSAKVTHKGETIPDFVERGFEVRSEHCIFRDVEARPNHATCIEVLTLETLTENMTRSELRECPMVKTVVRMIEAYMLLPEPWKVAKTRRLYRIQPTHLTRTSCPDGDRSTSARLMHSARTRKTFWQCICLNACICLGLVTGKICFFQMSSGDLASLFGVTSAYLTVVSFVSLHYPKRRGNS
ncbi:unnamed protein product [Schistocephalus solidus]|uniref:DUF4378 domain-containing protein n=1 Tax=Schistocephalus solidus TaxID=70667 RepID=A0A183SWZ7_SCHSO|nr:unnamed protein product [Schistocephalus solidus]